MSFRLLIHRQDGRQHSPFEDAVLSILSVVIVVSAIAIVFVPQTIVMDVAYAASSNSKQISIYGILLDETGEPIKGGVVEVFDSSGNRVAQGVTKNDGTFEVKFIGESDTYTVRLATSRSSDAIVGTVEMDAEPGMTFGLTGTVADPGIIFVPIPGY